MKALIISAACVLSGCFSGAEFRECPTDGQPCGNGGICVDGSCAPPGGPPVGGMSVGGMGGGVGGMGGGAGATGGEGGAGGSEPIVVDTLADLPGDVENREVTIKTGTFDGSIASVTNARIIRLQGGLQLDGQGRPGGPGGDGGAGEDTRDGTAAMNGSAGDAGSNPPDNPPGGMGGTAQQSFGQSGAASVFPDTCATFDPATIRPGGGGAGAGGGRGGSAAQCVGPGGGGGGAGGPGGGAIRLVATEEIIISGTLSVRGEAGGDGGEPGVMGCENCDSCDAMAGRGGAGAADVTGGSGDGGGGDAGRGGTGGAGSGGLIIIDAPIIRFENARLNVAGGEPDNPAVGGLVYLRGTVMGDFEVIGTSMDRDCRASAADM